MKQPQSEQPYSTLRVCLVLCPRFLLRTFAIMALRLEGAIEIEMATNGKSAAHERRDPMNGSEENAAFYYSPYRRTRDQIDRDVSRGRVYPLADVLFKFL